MAQNAIEKEKWEMVRSYDKKLDNSLKHYRH